MFDRSEARRATLLTIVGVCVIVAVMAALVK